MTDQEISTIGNAEITIEENKLTDPVKDSIGTDDNEIAVNTEIPKKLGSLPKKRGRKKKSELTDDSTAKIKSNSKDNSKSKKLKKSENQDVSITSTRVEDDGYSKTQLKEADVIEKRKDLNALSEIPILTKRKRQAANKALSKLSNQSDDNRSTSDDDSSDTSENHNSTKNKLQSPLKKKQSVGLLSSIKTNSINRKSSFDKEHTDKDHKVKKIVSRIGDTEWSEAVWVHARVSAVNKAIDRLYRMSLENDNFILFGNDMIQCFYDVATVTGEPIRQKTLKYLEHLAHRWKYGVMQEGWKESNDMKPTVCEVIDVVIGMYCMERVGIRHDLKAEVLTFLNSPDAYEAVDYFGWDPKGQTPPADGCIEKLSGEIVSSYRTMSNSLIYCFYADRVGLSLGCSFADIFRWLPSFHPYKSANEIPWQDYIDQCYLITHIVFTMNNWGELSLDPVLFPHEYYFLRANLEVHLQQRDVHLIAEFVETLRAFGCDDKDDLIQRGMAALLATQQDDGIWDPSDEPYRTYHGTMCGVQALLAHKFRGFGPGIPTVVPLLLNWLDEDSKKVDEITKVVENMPQPPLPPAWRLRHVPKATKELVEKLKQTMKGIFKPKPAPPTLGTKQLLQEKGPPKAEITAKPTDASSKMKLTGREKDIKNESSKSKLAREDKIVAKDSRNGSSSASLARDKEKSKTVSAVDATGSNDVKKKLAQSAAEIDRYLKTGIGSRSFVDHSLIMNTLMAMKEMAVNEDVLQPLPMLTKHLNDLTAEVSIASGLDKIVGELAAQVKQEWDIKFSRNTNLDIDAKSVFNNKESDKSETEANDRNGTIEPNSVVIDSVLDDSSPESRQPIGDGDVSVITSSDTAPENSNIEKAVDKEPDLSIEISTDVTETEEIATDLKAEDIAMDVDNDREPEETSSAQVVFGAVDTADEHTVTSGGTTSGYSQNGTAEEIPANSEVEDKATYEYEAKDQNITHDDKDNRNISTNNIQNEDDEGGDDNHDLDS